MKYIIRERQETFMSECETLDSIIVESDVEPKLILCHYACKRLEQDYGETISFTQEYYIGGEIICEKDNYEDAWQVTYPLGFYNGIIGTSYFEIELYDESNYWEYGSDKDIQSFVEIKPEQLKITQVKEFYMKYCN